MAKSASGEATANATSVSTGTLTGQSGKFCIVQISTSDADSITTPSGWTLYDSGTDGNNRRYIFYRVLASTSSVTFSGTSSGKKALTWDTWDADDIDTSSPISSETPAEIVSGTTSSSRTNPTATLTGQPRYALALVMSRGGSAPSSWTPPSGFTLEGEAYNTSSGATTAASASRTYTATGSQGGGTWTSDTSEVRGTTYLIILQPSSTPVTGSIAADTPTVTIGVPEVSWSGTVTPPSFTGAIAADTPTVSVGVPTVAWSGAVTPPTFAGAIAADTPTVSIGVPTSSWSGTVTAPVFTGAITADTPAVSIGVPTVAWSGTVSAPGAVTGSIIADTPAVAIGVPTCAWTGTVTAPSYAGSIAASTPAVTIGVPTVAWSGTVTADPSTPLVIPRDRTLVASGPAFTLTGSAPARTLAGAGRRYTLEGSD